MVTVSNFPINFSDKDLVKVFEDSAGKDTVVSCQIEGTQIDKNGVFNRIAHLGFKEISSAEKACCLDGVPLKGTTLHVKPISKKSNLIDCSNFNICEEDYVGKNLYAR
jgi:uncharacterized protein YrrD